MMDDSAIIRMKAAMEIFQEGMREAAASIERLADWTLPLQIELFLIELEIDVQLHDITDWSLLRLFDDLPSSS
jgi:hypothetical protein